MNFSSKTDHRPVCDLSHAMEFCLILISLLPVFFSSRVSDSDRSGIGATLEGASGRIESNLGRPSCPPIETNNARVTTLTNIALAYDCFYQLLRAKTQSTRSCGSHQSWEEWIVGYMCFYPTHVPIFVVKDRLKDSRSPKCVFQSRKIEQKNVGG